MTNNILKALEASNAQLQKQGVNTTPPAATVEKIGSSQYDEGLTPGYNPNEYRAYNQPWQDKLGNGLVNMGTSAFTSALQSTVGLVFGATEALVTGKGSAMWDNDVTKANSIITEAARESYPFYYSEAEQNASTLGSMGYQNFWFDKAMSGAGYTVGSLVAGMGYAKVFNMGKTAQLTKLATDANKLEGIVGGLEGAAATHTKWNLAKEIGLGLTLANGESSLEAFETAKATEDFYLKARELGLAGDDAYKQYASLTDAQIEEYKTDAGNSNYLVNLAITGSTNFLLLRKFINPGSKETLKTYNNIGKKTLADGTVEYFDKVAAQKGAAYFNLGKKFMSGVIPESIQEGSQYASNIAAQEFVKNYHIENKDWFESVVSGIGEGISRTLSEKEGLQSIFLGGIIGGPFGMKGARGERLATNANTQKLIDVINKDPNFLDSNPKVKDFLAAVQASEKAENYIADGDIFEAKNKTAHALNTYVKSLIDAGAIEQFTTRLTSLKDIEQQEFEQYFGQGTVKEDLDKVLNQVEKLVKLNDNITTLYGISGGTEEERSYNKKLRDRFFFSASTINNMDARESSIEASLLELEGKNDLYDINELRKELHRDRKKEVPETLQGEDYNKYLANLKTITEDAYKTKLDKYTEDYPVESADALKYLGDLNRLTVKRKDFVTYYNALNNKEEADKLMKAEADALEEFINLAQNEEARKQAEADAVKESQLDPSLINDVFKKDVNASNKITSKDDGTELDLSSLDDAALRGLRDDYTTARDLFGEDNFNYSEALEAIERELDLRDGVITADSLKEQLANIKSETELAALVEEARKNGFIADQEKLKNITRALIEEQKRKDALTNTQNNAFSKFKDIQEFTRTFVLYSGDTQEEKNNNKRKAQEKLDYLLNNISAFSNDTRVSLTEEEESIIANFGIKVTPNENAGNLSKFDEQDQNPILFSKASPIKIEITYEGVPIAGIPYYAGFADKNGVSIDPTLMSYTEWVDLFKPVKYKSNEENFELYKDAYEKARDFFVFVNEALGPQGQLTSKTEIIFNSTEFLKLLAPTISSGSFDINTPQNAKSLIEEHYPLFDDDTSDFSYSYLLIDTRELTNGVIKSANNNHIDPVTLETREKYKDAIKALQERKTQGKINAKHLLQRYVILVEHPRGTITLLGDDARYEWMPLIPAKYEVSDLINKLKELKEAYVNKVIGADGYAMNNKAAATILNSEIFFSLESGWDVGLFLNESFTEFSLKFTYGETSVFANIKLNELENNLTPEFFLKTLNESLATPRNQNVKQQINGENADKVISQITGKEPISEDNFRIQVDKKIENVSANDILESFYSILSPNIKKNQSIIINHSAPKIPSTLPLETKPVTAPTFTTTPIANSAELKEIIIAIKDKIKASNNPNIKAQDPGAKEAFIRVGTTLGVKEDSLNSFYNGLAPLGGTTLIDSLDVILKYLDGNTVSVIQKAVIQNNLLSLLVKTALSTPETQPSASTTNIEKQKRDLQYSINQLEKEFQDKVDVLIANGASEEEAKKIALDETSKKNIVALEKLKTELAALGTGTKTNPTPSPKTRVDPRDGGTIDPFSHVNSSGEQRSIERNLQEAFSYLKEVFGSSISAEEFKGLEENLAKGKVRYGNFKDALIRLSRFSPEGTEYHEAFHGVFRMFLTDSEIEYYTALGKETLYQELKDKGISITQAFKEFKKDFFLKNPGKIINDTDLKNLMIEEFLADKYKAWKLAKVKVKKTGIAGLLQSLWEKLQRALNIFTESPAVDSIEGLFEQIDRGSFKNKTAVVNKFKNTVLPADISLYAGTKEDPEDGRRYPRFLNEHVANQLISTVVARVNQMRKENLKISFDTLIEKVLNELHLNFALNDTRYDNLIDSKNEKAIDLYYDLGHVLNKESTANREEVKGEKGVYKITDFSPREAIKEAAKTILRKFNFNIDKALIENEVSEEELETGETTTNELSPERNRDLNQENLGGYKNLSKKLRAYISLTTYSTNLNDFFKVQGVFSEDHNITLAVDVKRVYNGIAKATQNSLTSKEIMTKLIHYRNVSSESKRVIDKLLKDLNFPIESFLATGEYNEIDLNPDTIDIYHAFVKGFNLHSFDHMFTEYDFDLGVTRGYFSNRKGSDNEQHSKWYNIYSKLRSTWGATKEDRIKYVQSNIVPKLEKARQSIIIDTKVTLTEEALNTRLSALKEGLGNVGITLSDGLLKYFILNNSNYTNKSPEQISYVETFKYNMIESQVYFETTIEELISHLIKDANPFIRNEVIKKEKRKERETKLLEEGVDEKEAAEKSIETGLVSRILTLAKNNATFDETLSPNSYLNAEYKAIYSLQKPTADSIIALAIAKGREDLLPLNYKSDPYFKEHRLLNNPIFKNIKKYLKILREDGGRVRFLKYENNTFKTDPFKQTEEGVSFGSYKGRELALAEYSHYLNKKFDSLAGETTTIVRPVILDIMENASSLNLIPLPVVDSFTYNTETNSAGLTDTFKDAIVTEVKREWERIQRVKAEGLDPSTRKEQYNWGVNEENTANLRGYNFWHFKPLLTFNNSSLAKDLANSTEFEDFQDALLEQIDAFYNDQLTQHLEQLVKTGILRKNYTGSEKKVTYANVLLDTRYGSRMVKPQGKNWIFEEEAKRKSTLKQMAGDNMTSPFTSNYVVHNIAQVFFSNYLNRLSYNQLIKGDPSEGMANPIDWFKRSKGRNGSGDSLYSELMPVTRYAIIGKRNTSGKLEDPNKLFKVTNRLLDPNNLKDMQEYNDLITTIQTDPALTEAEKNKALKDLQNKGKVEITDGQGYLSATAYRNYLHGLGKLNKETWAIYNKIIAGEKISPKENTLLIKQGVVGNSLKVVYYDGVKFLKLSVQLLSKEEVSVEIDGVWQSRPGKEAKFAMLNQMEEHSIDLVVPPSVTKTLKENAIELNDDDSFTVDNPTKQINIISNLFGRLQQENPSNKTTSILPTQNENLIEAEQNVDQTIVYPSDLNITTVGHLLDKFRQVKGQKADREYVSVKNVIFSLQKGTTTPELGRLAKLMKEALLRTGATGQLLEFFETDENGIPAYDFANMPHTQSKFEALYNAHFNNVFKQRVAGYKTTLQSAFGHKLMYYETNGVETILNSAEFNDNPKKYLQEYKEGKLKVRELSYNKVRYNEKGEEIGLYTEFVMSAHFAEQFNLKPGDIIPDSIAYMFGVRIPSQDKHSAVSLKLVDILPNYMGSNAVFPHELIKIMGHDFDIDSLYIHRPAHYVNKKGQIKVFGNTEESAYEQYLTHYKEDSFVKLIKEELVNSELEEGITFSKERVYTLEILQKLYKAKEILQEAKESASTPEELDELNNDIAEAKLETGNYKEHLKALEDYLLTKALETLGLPSTEEAFIKETKKSGELNPSVLSNEMLTAKIALHTNKSVKEIITTPASLIVIEKALDKLATLKGLTSHEELNAIYDVNSLSSLMEALASNRAGEESIGASVNASQVFTRLSSYGITIGEKFSYLLPIIDNYISGGYLNNTTQDNIRIMDILSTITTAMTDNPKWGFVNKLGLSLQVLAAVSNLVSLGYNFETSIFLVNQDYLKKHIEAIEAKSNNLRAPGERSVDLNKMLQRTLTELAEEIKKIDPKFDPKRFGNTFTTEELEEGLKVKDREGEERLQYLLTNYNALNFYDQFEPITNTFSKVGSIMKITKGTGASFGEEDAFFKTLNDLGGEFVKNSKGEWKLVTKKSNKIMPGILKVFTEHALTIKNLAILADKKDITKNVAIRRTSLFEKTLKGSLATFKARIFNRVAKENALSKNLLSFLVLRAYEKQERETLFSISNVTQTLYKLNEDQQTLRDEYLTLSEKYPDLVGNSVALFSIEFNDPTKNGFSSNTYTTTKGSPEFEERISNDFENLYNHQQTRPFIIKLFNYLIAKDALQFKNQSFINIMPPTIFKRYSKASKKVQELLKKNSSPEEFMKLFDKTENAVIDEYMELHVRNPETFYDIVTPHETLTEKNLPLTIGKDTEGNTTFTIDLFKGMEVSDFKNDLYSLTEALTNTGEDFSMEDLVSKLKKETSEKRSEIFKTNLEAIANFPELFIISSYEDKQQNETKFRLRILFKDGIRLPKTETRKATIAVLTNAENSTMTKQGPVFTAAERNSLGLKQGTKATYTLKDFVGNKFNKVTPFGMGLAQAETVTQEKLMPQILEEDGESSIFETLTNKIFKPTPTVTKTIQPSTSVKEGVEVTSENYTSELLRINSDKLFLFGDNNQRVGTGGQAIIRNEPNAIGISTKLLPKDTADAFMTDSDLASNKITINEDIRKVKERASKEGKTIVLPKGGFGTGLAKLATKAPQTFAYLNKRLQEEFGFNNITGEISTLNITQSSSITTIIENKKKEGEAKLGLIEPDLLPKRSILMQELINSLVTEKGGSPLKYVGEVNKLTDEQLIEEWNKRCNTL